MTINDHPGADAQLLVVAENLLSRAGLTAVLEERGCLVLAQTDGADLGQTIDQLEPDALVIDFGWDSDGLRKRLLQLEADLPILAIVAAAAQETLDPLVQALRLFPAFALLPRDSEPGSIVAALSALAAGLTVLDPSLTSLLAASARNPREAPLNPLTEREDQVLQHLARGLTNRAIALELGITQHTVKFHVNAIMSKLDAQSRTEAVVRATQLGMIVL